MLRRFGSSQSHPSRCRPTLNGSLLLSLSVLYPARLVTAIHGDDARRAPDGDLAEPAAGTLEPASAATASRGRPPGRGRGGGEARSPLPAWPAAARKPKT